jgi:uncharacterized cupredoxin-like copper-binding protein
VALNGSDGSVAWQVELASGPLSGVTVAGDVVFAAGLDGVIRGHNLADGSEVFRYQATAGINTSPAVSGDFMYWPAGGPLLPSTDTWNPPPEAKSQVIALKIGGTVQVQPSPAAEATPEEGAATPEEQATPSANTVSIDMVDLAFQPNTFTISANVTTALTFTNMGQLPHNFTCDPLNLKTKDLNPGESETISVMAAAGEYDFYCAVPGHKDAGMVGVLTVE